MSALATQEAPWTDVPMGLYKWENGLRPKITYHYRIRGVDEQVQARRGKVWVTYEIKGIFREDHENRILMKRVALSALCRALGLERKPGLFS